MSFDYYEFKREKRAYNRTAPKKLDYIYALEATGTKHTPVSYTHLTLPTIYSV